SPSAMSHPWSSKRSTIGGNPVWPSRPDLNPELSGIPGTIQDPVAAIVPQSLGTTEGADDRIAADDHRPAPQNPVPIVGILDAVPVQAHPPSPGPSYCRRSTRPR